MFGIKRKHLVTNLCNLAAKACGYRGEYCDCKYSPEATEDNIKMRHSEATGCPEISMAAAIIASMSEQEFSAVSKRAGFEIFDEEMSINVGELIKKFKKSRFKKTELAPGLTVKKSSKK